MIREIRYVTDNARFTAKLGYPEVPLLFFDPGGSETGLDTWSSMLVSYLKHQLREPTSSLKEATTSIMSMRRHWHRSSGAS